jgi:hypothetical protein
MYRVGLSSCRKWLSEGARLELVVAFLAAWVVASRGQQDAARLQEFSDSCYDGTLRSSWVGNPCSPSWLGITCDSNGFVTDLELNGMDLTACQVYSDWDPGCRFCVQGCTLSPRGACTCRPGWGSCFQPERLKYEGSLKPSAPSMTTRHDAPEPAFLAAVWGLKQS